MDVFDAAMRYKEEGRPVIVLAGNDYGSGSSRDWAAKGPYLLVCTASSIIQKHHYLLIMSSLSKVSHSN